MDEQICVRLNDLFLTDSETRFTSAGTPIPDFKVQTKEQEDEHWWRMKTYEENYIKPYLQNLYETKSK